MKQMQYFQTKEDLEFILIENMDKTYEKHNHISKCIVGMVLQGSVTLEKELKKTEYQKNDAFFIPVGQIHALEMNDKNARVLSLCIGVDFLKKYNMQVVLSILEDYLIELERSSVIPKGQLVTMMNALCMFLSETHMETTIFKYQQDSKEILQMKNMIVNTPEQELNIEYLSNQVHFSKYHMIRKFKKYVGLTPHKFLVQNRVRKAQRLMQKGYSVADAALEMGFCDQSHFIKCFQAIVRIAPGEYMKSIKKLD